MNVRIMKEEYLKKFEKYLWEEEKSSITIEKIFARCPCFFEFFRTEACE